MSKTKITIRGRSYDLKEIGDLAGLQKELVPDNWPTKKSEGVELFLSLQNMIALQLKRHLAANFKTILKTAIEQSDDGDKAAVNIGYTFTIDVTAPTVATISAHKLGFSVKHETKGKPQTHDLAQGEFLDEDMSIVFDVKGFEKENAEPPPEAPPEPETPEAPTEEKPKKKGKKDAKKD